MFFSACILGIIVIVAASGADLFCAVIFIEYPLDLTIVATALIVHNAMTVIRSSQHQRKRRVELEPTERDLQKKLTQPTIQPNTPNTPIGKWSLAYQHCLQAGGYQEATLNVQGPGAWTKFKFESGA